MLIDHSLKLLSFSLGLKIFNYKDNKKAEQNENRDKLKRCFFDLLLKGRGTNFIKA